MKNLKLNLKGLYGYRQSLLSRSPQPRDNREMSERRPSEERTLLAPVPQRFARYAAMLIMLLTLGVGQMWADWYISGTSALTGNSWGTPPTGKISDGTVKFINIAVNSGDNAYQFKLTDGTGWYGGYQFSNGTATGTVVRTSTSSWDNAEIEVHGWKSDVTFSYDGNANHYYSAHGDPVLFIAGNGSGDSNGNWCAGKSWLDNGTDGLRLTKTATNKYSIKYSDVASGDYQFKINDGTWSYYLNNNHMANTSPTNVTLSSSGSPNYNICFSLTGTSDVTVMVDISGGTTDPTKWKVYVTVEYSGLTVSAANTSSSPTISATTVNKGSGVTVTANAATGYEIDSWSSDNGSFANASTASTTFTPTSNDAEAVATYKEKTYSVTVATANSSYGKVMDDQTSTTVNAKHFTSDCEITATPEEGYRFAGWTKTGNVTIANAASASTTIKATSTGATVTATFEELPAGQLEVVAGAHGSVKIDGEDDWLTTSYTYTDQNDDVDLKIYAKADANYHFVNWTKVGDGTIKTNAATGEYSLPGRGSATVTANFAETTYAVTIGTDGVGTVGSTSPSGSTQVGAVTPVAVSAPAAKAGYKWGRWVTSANVTAASPTSASTSLTATGTGTATATYDEDLSTTFYVRGGGKFDNSWDSNTKPMTKKTGHSTESVAYFTVSIDAAVGESADTDYDFKIYNSANSTEYGLPADGAAYWWTRSTTTQSLNASGKPIQLRADIAGDYEIKVDYSGATPTVTVTFPTSYTLTYAIGSVAGHYGSVSTSPSTASGSRVLGGTNVTLTAPEPAPGYSWSGWYTNAAGTEGNIADEDRAIMVTMNSDKTLYACYTENSNTVTVNVNGGGKVSYNSGAASTLVNASAGVNTFSATISAIPDDGYAFVGWTGVNAGNHITNYDNVGDDEGWNSTNEGFDIKVKADAATTITANFQPRFALMGSLTTGDANTGGMPGWSTPAYATYSDGTYIVSCDLTNPNSTYKFKIIDLRHKSWVYRGYSTGENNLAVDNTTTYTLNSETSDVYFDSRGVGTYTFTIVEEEISSVVYPKVKIQDGANSHMITWGYVSDNGREGGTITSVVDGEATPNSIASGKYVKDGGSITATAEEKSGYRFIDFRTSSTYGGGSQLGTSKTYTVASVKADQNIYAQFAENLCTVTITANDKTKGSIVVGDEDFAWDGTVNVGVYNYKSLAVTPVAGYYFAGWTLSTSPDFSVDDAGESGASTNLRGIGGTHGSTGTLTANFQPLDTIYFKNTLSWAKVFVYFNPSWDYAETPSSSKGVYPIGAEYTEMTNIGDNIYRALIPRSFTRNNYTKVAFSDVDMSGYTNFNGNNAVYRDDWDYNTKTLDMYIPCVNTNDGATRRGTNQLVFNGTTYYNHGYWVKKDVKINDGMGYYIKNSSSLDKQFTAIADDEHTGKVTVRVDNLSNQTYYICSAGGREYSNTGITFTSGGGDNQTLYIYNSRGYFTVTPSAEGDYTFYLYQDGDHMSINVSYPVSPGDYRIRHSYTDGGTKYSYSDIIKKSTTSDKVSMYIRNTSGTLKIAKCSGLDANKKPLWTDGIGVTGYTAANFPSAGVYVFDVAIVDDKLENPEKEVTSATISNVAPYTGDFYIKTDCAPGGWTSYKSNILDKNTVNFNESDASTFDYYHCNWAPSNTNVKCVIANDYNIQLTDTLKTDAILLACSPDATNHQSIPQNTSIRFSYNSKTNELKRAYLASVSGTDVSNVKIKPSTSEYVYQKDAATDLFSGANLKEAGNWTYQIDVDVYPGDDSQTKIETVYPTSGTGSATRELVGNTILLGSGSKGTNKYRVRLLYDFKTNKLTSAFIPSETIDATINLNTDYLYARVGEGSSTQLSFSEDGALNNVKKAYAAFEFPKDQMVGFMPDWTSNDYRARRYCRYYFSLPFAVRICDIFGVGEYGNQYIIQKYNGEKRAEIGWFQDTDTFWETLGDNEELEPNRGYALMLDREAFNDGSNGVWTNIQAGGSTFLYFPSKENVNTISGSTGSYTIVAHPHTSNRVNSKTGEKHSDTDSNWAMIGANAYGDVYTQAGGRPAGRYEYNPATNGWTLNAGDKTDVYKSLHAYMVQWAGTFQWQTTTPASVAARQKDVVKNNTIQLNLIQNDEVSDKTFVKLNNEASTEFVLNEDVCKIINSGVPNIYTYAGVYDVALSQVPEENQIVSVGVVIRKNGTYTFSMPENINGTVTLIDEFEQTRTNLSLSDYEVTLPKGTNNDRFKLEINVKKIPTAIDGVEGEGTLKDGKAHKFLQNGVMYILQNGCLYDAQGRRVE